MRKIWSSLVFVLVVAVAVPSFAAGPVDSQSYAKEFNVSIEEAARRLDLQQRIGELSALLEAEESSFAGLWIEHKPQYRVVVRFADPLANERLAKRIAGTPLESLVVTRPARVPLADLEKQQKALREAGRNAGIDFNSDIDVRTGRLDVFTLQPEKLRATLGESLLKGVNVQRVSRLVETQAAVGGDMLADCTLGFGIRYNGTGELGIATAGHCSNWQTWNGIWLPFGGEKFSKYTDAQWHTTCGIVDVTNEVRVPGGLRPITATRSRTYQNVGDYVCRSGAVTGYACGNISGKHYDPGVNYDGTFVTVYEYGATYGDSGAPWFQEHVALGLHHGRTSDGRSIYMPINYISEIGVTVLTYNPGACTRPPVASFTYSNGGFFGINFDASGSYDPNGSIVQYTWDFGDGVIENSTSPYTSHVFDMWQEYYTVVLTVLDSEGLTSSTSRTVRVCNGPGQPVCPY